MTVTLDTDLGEATSYIDGNYDGYQTGLPLPQSSGIFEPGTHVWIGVRPPTDLDAFGRSDSEGAGCKMHIMDAFLWGRCLTDDEVAAFHATMGPSEDELYELPEDACWHGGESSRVTFCLFSHFIYLFSLFRGEKLDVPKNIQVGLLYLCHIVTLV